MPRSSCSPLLFVAAAVLSGSLAGCGEPGTAPTVDAGSWDAAYVIATTLQANTPQATTLLVAVPSLAAGTEADYAMAIPIADTVSLFGVEGSGRVYASAAMSPTVTRYDVEAAGHITPGARLDFAAFGLGATYSTRSIAIVSDQKAYLLDDTTLQAVTFDPSEMTVGRAVALGPLAHANYRTNFSYNVLARGHQLVIAAFYYDATYSRTIPETTIALLDTDTDAVTVVRDTRCGAFSTAAATASGDLYFGSDTYSVAIHRIGGDAAAPAGCLLRMKAGANVLDPEFFVPISDVTGGQPGGGVVWAGADSLWVRAFDESLLPVDATTSAFTILGANAWRWWKVDPTGARVSATRSEFPPGAGEVRTFVVSGHALAANPGVDYVTSGVLDMTGAGAPSAGLVVKGLPSGIVRVR